MVRLWERVSADVPILRDALQTLGGFAKNLNGEDMERYAIYGCGGFGREVLPIVRNILTSGGKAGEVIFVSDVDTEVGRTENGVEVIAFDDLVSAGHRDRKVIV